MKRVASMTPLNKLGLATGLRWREVRPASLGLFAGGVAMLTLPAAVAASGPALAPIKRPGVRLPLSVDLGASSSSSTHATGLPGTLSAVACASALRCWAVGNEYTDNGDVALNKILRWNGKQWSAIARPNPGGTTPPGNGLTNDNGLDGVACVSASDCWAVGLFAPEDLPEVILDEALRWNGNRWSLLPTPRPPVARGTDVELDGVACVSASDCWAVGFNSFANQAVRWNGKRWSAVPTPNSGFSCGPEFCAPLGLGDALNGVACVSASYCWAVGDYDNAANVSLNQVLRWNGRRWSKVSTPNPGGRTYPTSDNELNGVACASASLCWAVGTFSNSVHSHLNQVLRWNGKRWSLVSTPNPGSSNSLGGVACVYRSRCWAVGSFANTTASSVNQVLRSNGSRWSLVSTPDPGNGSHSLRGVACVSASRCWAVGSFGTPCSTCAYFTGSYANEVLRWNGRQWSAG